MNEHQQGPGDWVRVPIGDQSQKWSTVRFERSVLVVARTLTITLWGLDFLDEVLSDTRVQVVFSVDDRNPSAFRHSAARLLSQVEAATVPWPQATSTTFDLAISFSFNGDLEQLQCPLLLGLHGASLGKYAALPPDGRFPVPNLPEPRAGIFPTTVAIPHPAERTRYGAVDPRVNFAIVGDPCLDRLLASVPRRNQYRQALGVNPDQKLVVVSSTWGPDAMLATTPDIATQLTASLPADEYRVALIIHPNIWTGHGGWQTRSWLKRAHDAGVLAIPPWTNTWRSVLVASDAVIHDHGSVSLYAAALNKPLLAAPTESDNLIQDSLTAELGRRARTLNLSQPHRPQIDAAIKDHDPTLFKDIAAGVSDRPGESLRLHRDLIYGLIQLEAPTTQPRTLAVDLPPEPVPSIYSYHVRTTIETDNRVAIQRFPAITAGAPPPGGGGGPPLPPKKPPPPPQALGRQQGRNITLSPTRTSPTPASRRTQPLSSIRMASTHPNLSCTATPAAATRSARAHPATGCCTATAQDSCSRPETATPTIQVSQRRPCTHKRPPGGASATEPR